MRPLLSSACLLCLVLLAAGCAEIVVRPPVGAAPPRPTGTWRAGAAKADLTPIPGFPMGGYSLTGQIARGYWTRLQANAIYLEDPAGHRLALVSCDLWSMPAGLADRVAELVASDARGRPHPAGEIVLARDQLIIAATHTHQSPGNFSSSSAYNTFGSPQAGFDRRLFEFLAHRISEAILGAVRAARPASMTYAEGLVPELARNRSFPPFLQNKDEAPTILAGNASIPELSVPGAYPPAPHPYSSGVIYRAVRPRLGVLTLRARDDPNEVIAIAAFVAAHPTSIGHRTPLYTGDFFAVAVILAERALESRWPSGSPVVAIFNGAEGDVSPSWQCRDPQRSETCQERTDAIALGRTLATRLLELQSQGHDVSGSIAYRLARNFDLAGQCVSDQPGLCTASAPMIGAAMVGGTPDGRSEAYHLGWREGAVGPETPGQGPKRPAFDLGFVPATSPIGLSRFLFDALSAPVRVPLGLYRIGPLLLATVPGEFTTVMGLRIERALAKTMRDAGRPVERVIVVGLANEYMSYFTTPEEYELQYYEGASTVYGPASGLVIEDRLALLARQFGDGPVSQAEAITYSPGPGARFGLWEITTEASAADGLAHVLQDEAGRPLANAPMVCWSERSPVLPSPYDPGRRVTPSVAIEVRRGGGRWEPLKTDGGGEESDRGINFVTTAHATFLTRSEWCVRWLGHVSSDSDVELRFHVQKLGGASLYAPVKRPPR